MISIGEILADITSGISPVCDQRLAAPDEPGVLTLAAITGGAFDPRFAKAVFDDQATGNWPTVQAGSLLITRASGSKRLVGACVLTRQDLRSRFIPDTAWRLAISKEVDIPPEWVFEFLISGMGRKAIERIARGTSGIWKISKASFRRIMLPVKTSSEMRLVANASKAFAQSALTLSLTLSANRDLKRALSRDMLTGNLRLTAFKDQPWRDYRLGDLFVERNENGYPDLPLLSVTGDRGVIPRVELDRRDTSSSDKTDYKRVCPGDIAYNTMRMWQGVSALSRHEGIVSPAYTVVSPRAHLEGRFASQLFKLPMIVHRFWRHSQGMVDDTLSLKYGRFSRIRVSIPDTRVEQMVVADLLELVDRSIRVLEQSLACLQMHRDAVMRRMWAQLSVENGGRGITANA
jgi:type I restriction enzyme S subunit